MHHLFYRLAMAAAVGCFLGASISAILCSFAAISVKKGRLKLLSLCLLGGGSIVSALAMIGYQRSLKIYQAAGIIHQVHVSMTGKEHRTSLQVATDSGAEVALKASGTSIYFRPGEHLIVTYQEETGSILKATFLQNDGAIEGQFRGTGLWPAYVLLIGGLWIIYVGFKVNRRDPVGAEERHWNARPSGQIDEPSLMHLSGERREDRKT